MPITAADDGSWSPNKLLRALSNEEILLLQPHIQRVSLVMEQTLQGVGEVFDHVFLVESGIVSMVADTQDNGSVEVGLVGREGLIGISAALNPDTIAIHRALVQVPGSAIRMRTTAFRDALDRSPQFRDRCLRFAHYLMSQASQTSACNVRHELVERLARWLLMAWDRVGDDELPMRQEFLALMLGVRRSGVSVVVNALQSTGAIRQLRGRVVLVDRATLETEACSCYGFLEDRRRSILRDEEEA